MAKPESRTGYRDAARIWRIMQEANSPAPPRPLSEMIREAERNRGVGGSGGGYFGGMPPLPTPPLPPVGPTGIVDELGTGPAHRPDVEREGIR